MIKVLGLGDNVVDKYMHIKTMYPGGNALNIAVLAKLSGIEAGYFGVFGDDEAAKHVYKTTADMGIDVSHCRFYLKDCTVDFCTQAFQMALHGAVQACAVHVKPQTA